VDYSLSWSPSSTLNSWDVDWGDGNTSTGAWPGAGSVGHPTGGYAIPATYTITLSVTDLLGAIGYAQVQVEILDCTVGPPIELLGGCGASGVWYTQDAGLNWDNVSGKLTGTAVYDVKANPFTLGTDRLTIWAATADGLFSQVAAAEWTQSILPSPPGYSGITPTPVSIVCSKYAPTELYVLAYYGNVTWVYRSVDDGETWQDIRRIGSDNLVLEQATAMACGISYLGHIDETLYSFETETLGSCNGCSALRRRNSDNTWTTISTGRPAGSAVYAATDYDDRIYACGTSACVGGNKTVYGIRSSWSTGDTGVAGIYYAIQVVSGVIYCASYEAGPTYDLDKVTLSGSITDTIANPAVGWNITIFGLGQLDGSLYANFSDGADHRIYRLSGTTWTLEDTHTGGNFYGFAEFDDKLYASYSNEPYIRVRIGSEWQDDDDQITNGAYLNVVTDYDTDRQYLTAVVTANAYKRTAYGWTTMAYYSPSLGTRINMDGGDIISAYSGIGLFRLQYGNAQIPTNGRTHLLGQSADGYYIYACVLNNSGQPMLFRLSYDLSEMTGLYNPGAGTWGGVLCDPWMPERIWIFGDWGTEKVLLSEDWGDAFTDITDGTWGGSELVRPLLLSDWDSDDVIGILNDAGEVWQSIARSE